MQEIHSIENGRNFFCGVNRSMNPHHLNTQTALNCPRCNSLNTKFCYYNNYNLSQPRHFCKNCRRYWTKGGVLRNVPVGGGSRKSKRSTKPNNKKSTPSTTSEIAPVTTEQPPQPLPEHSSNSHSSSESSTLTAAAATEAISAPASNAASNLFSVIPEQVGGDHCGILTSLTSTSFGYRNNKVLDASSFCFGKTHQQLHGYNQVRVAHDSGSLDAHYNREGYPTTSFPDQTMPTLYGGFGSLDWHTGMGQNLFDLPNTVDQSYWTNLHLPGHYNSTLSASLNLSLKKVLFFFC